MEQIEGIFLEDPLFWTSALLGAGILLLQFFLSSHHEDIDNDSGQFKWLSKQAITGFLLFFGSAGLTCRRQFHCDPLPTFLIAFAAGALVVLLSGLILKTVQKLRSPGLVFRLQDAIGKDATIYQRIPKGGVGKISLSLHQLTYEIDAISDHPTDLQSFTNVQVIKTVDDKTVLVVPIP